MRHIKCRTIGEIILEIQLCESCLRNITVEWFRNGNVTARGGSEQTESNNTITKAKVREKQGGRVDIFPAHT